MRSILTLLAIVATACGFLPPRARADDLALRVRDLFASHCAQCHGTALARPKGKFGYVTDLEKLVAEARVVPNDLVNSEIYELITTADLKFRMPPKAAKAGPLSSEQIDLVRAWIMAGAPAPGASPAPGSSPALADPPHPLDQPADAVPPTPPSSQPVTGSPLHHSPAPVLPRSVSDRVLAFAGKFHPVIVHFPIALLVVAALAEVLVMAGWKMGSETNRLLVPLGAVAAIFAVVLGLLSASSEGFALATIWTHRLLGIVAASFSLVALVCQALGKVLPYRITLFAAAGLTGLAGHFGGLITFGDDHFAF